MPFVRVLYVALGLIETFIAENQTVTIHLEVVLPTIVLAIVN